MTLLEVQLDINETLDITLALEIGGSKILYMELKVSNQVCDFAWKYLKPEMIFYTKYHFVNILSHRFEVYAEKNDDCKRFREKMYKTNKIQGNLCAHSTVVSKTPIPLPLPIFSSITKLPLKGSTTCII